VGAEVIEAAKNEPRWRSVAGVQLPNKWCTHDKAGVSSFREPKKRSNTEGWLRLLRPPDFLIRNLLIQSAWLSADLNCWLRLERNQSAL